MIRRSNHLLGLALVGQLALAGCADGGGGPEERPAVQSQRSIDEVLEAHTDSLMALPGVVGTALGLCDDAPCIVVYLADSSAEVRERIPERLEGHPVRAEVSGEIRPRGR
ncbi:MAG: hypothetical protein GWM92_16955 [Gemmatimonadetes bacterium]|nr:hypothetical protein [Gemmatimonadota bacterium]NIY41057.1 hypothetical protein [Gemmatimonadota bacterium]